MLAVLGLGDPLACSRWTLLVLADHFVPPEDLELLQILSNTQASPDEVSVGGYGVSIRMERDVAFDIHVPLVEVIDLGDVDRQRFQGRLLGDPEGSRGRAEVSSEPKVCVVAPGPELEVAVLEAGEVPARVEVVLDVVKGPLDPGGAVRVADGVGLEHESEVTGERLHDGRSHGVLASAVRDDHRTIVDHATPGCPTHVLQSFLHETARLEAGPPMEDPSKDEPAVTEDEARALELVLLSVQRDRMRRCVMLHLLSGEEAILPRWLARLDSYPLPAAESGQGRVSVLEQVPPFELFRDTDQVSPTLDVKLTNRLDVVVELALAVDRGHLGLATIEDSADAVPRDAEGPRDGALAVSLLVELENRLPGVLVVHREHPSGLEGFRGRRTREARSRRSTICGSGPKPPEFGQRARG